MPTIIIDVDGTVVAKNTKEEISNYYDVQIGKRVQAMLMLQVLGGNITMICNKVQQLNVEKKQKLAEVG
jgi:hypothetical protein